MAPPPRELSTSKVDVITTYRVRFGGYTIGISRQEGEAIRDKLIELFGLPNDHESEPGAAGEDT